MIYLNNAATSWPKPSSVCEAVQACLMDTPASQFRGGSAILKKDTEERCREKLGKLLGIQAHDRIFFTSGATESLNTVLCGLDYGEEGRGILATQTEHNSVLRPLMNQPVLKKHPVTIISCLENGAVTRNALEKGLEEALENTGKNPSALIVNHCSNVTGYVQDMKLIGNFVRENNLLLLVDVSQSAGCIPVDADSWRADGVIFTGHKSLLGIQGTGGFFIRKGLELKPLKYGGTGRNSQQLTYEDGDYEYEVGTQNLPGIKGTSCRCGIRAGKRRGQDTGKRRKDDEAFV